jgi:hypothetical protein
MNADLYYLNYPRAEELSAILGNRWTVARKTPRNLARYERCITRKEYLEACKKALAQRAK